MLWLDLQSASQGSSRDDLIKGLSAGALGLIGTVVTLLYGWFKDRDTTARRTKELEEAAKRVSFWENWYRAISPLDSGNDGAYWRERARTEMWYASVTIEELFRSHSPRSIAETETELYVAGLSKWRRWFLFYNPPRSRAWIPRVIFYLYFFVAPFSLPYQFHLQNKQREHYLEYQEQRLHDLESESSAIPSIVEERDHLREEIGYKKSRKPNDEYDVLAFIGGALFAMAFSLLFRSWSLSLEKPVQPTPVAPVVLDSDGRSATEVHKRSVLWPFRRHSSPKLGE